MESGCQQKNTLDSGFIYAYRRDMRFYTSDEVLLKLWQAVNASSQRQVATDTGFAPQYINDVLRGRRELSKGLAFKLGYKRMEDRYRRIAG